MTPKLSEILKTDIKLTPMMAQYADIKKEYPDTLVLFRMGDFYELFFEDAKKASDILNITLTHRGKLGPYSIPMAGIPHHAASTYIDRITARGLKAAICEQIEDPKLAKGIVKRAVTQVVSPGMPYDLEKSNKLESNYIASGWFDSDANAFFLVLVDFTTGDFKGMEVSTVQDLLDLVRLYSPKEFICYLGQWENYQNLQNYLESGAMLVTHLSEDLFEHKNAELYLKKLIPNYKRNEVLKLHRPIISPIGALAYYITSTQDLSELQHLRPFRLENRQEHMIVTLPTLTGLEILPKERKLYNDSLLGFFDRTKTAMGARQLRQQFLTPLRGFDEIHSRQQMIKFLVEEHSILVNIREALTLVRDLERIMAKAATKKANVGDLINITHAFRQYQMIKTLMEFPKDVFPILSNKESNALEKLVNRIEKLINDEIGASLDKGNLIKAGADSQRDRLAGFTHNAAQELLALENKYRQETGITNLKVKFNNVQGYFIEVSKGQCSKVSQSFERKQTLTNNERFVTEELN
ncbi:MAG: hypothetical protein ACOCUH_03275, partial [Bacteriovoracia bacterium]